MPFCSPIKKEDLQELMHGKVIISPNRKNNFKCYKTVDEELLSKANNKFFTPDEFNHALKELVDRTYALYMMIMICFCGMIDLGKVFGLIFS